MNYWIIESTLDSNIMANAVTRDKFAQTLSFIVLFLYFTILAIMEIEFECCVALHCNDSKNAGKQEI